MIVLYKNNIFDNVYKILECIIKYYLYVCIYIYMCIHTLKYIIYLLLVNYISYNTLIIMKNKLNNFHFMNNIKLLLSILIHKILFFNICFYLLLLLSQSRHPPE